MPVKDDRSVGWTPRSAAVTFLLAMEDHRRQAGLRLVQLREQLRWNQEDLAHASGLSVKTISRFENGRHDGRRTTIQKLARALGVDENDITGPPPAPLGLDAKPADDLTARLDRIEQLVARALANQEAIYAGMQALMEGGALLADATQPPEDDDVARELERLRDVFHRLAALADTPELPAASAGRGSRAA